MKPDSASGQDSPGRITIQGRDVRLSGDWTLPHYSALKAAVRRQRRKALPVDVSLKQISQLDTAGAVLVVELLGVKRVKSLVESGTGMDPASEALVAALAAALDRESPAPGPEPNVVRRTLVRLGKNAEGGVRHFGLLAGFTGLVLATFITVILRPRRWRWNALITQIHQTGLNAVPIVALLTFLVGAVVAFLGATVLTQFGAEVFTIDLVAFSFLREFGVLLAAILVAGRTASAFAAQIGSMKADEELDALRTFGLSPVEVLVLPRVLALLLVLPILSVLGVFSGLAGGALAIWVGLGIPVSQFIDVLADVPLEHYLVGLGKAPVFAFVIAAIGCLEGTKVTGSAESVGGHTTSSVVQSIFMVILLDALAAIWFMEMGW
ncbi:MAG: ABC transporter permease [Oleiphilaceae bacterium]|nr:ABC transporter permease [Oleiphilaceae bacterium]